MNRNIIFHHQYIGINSNADKSILSAEARGWKYTVPVRPYPQAMSGVGTFLCFSSPSYRFCINGILITFRNGRFFPMFLYGFWSPIALTISLHVMVSGHWLPLNTFNYDLWYKYIVHLKFNTQRTKLIVLCVTFNKITLSLYNKYKSRGIF